MVWKATVFIGGSMRTAGRRGKPTGWFGVESGRGRGDYRRGSVSSRIASPFLYSVLALSYFFELHVDLAEIEMCFGIRLLFRGDGPEKHLFRLPVPPVLEKALAALQQFSGSDGLFSRRVSIAPILWAASLRLASSG